MSLTSLNSKTMLNLVFEPIISPTITSVSLIFDFESVPKRETFE